MDIIKYRKQKTFKLFGKIDLMTTVEEYSESIRQGETEPVLTVIEVSNDYFHDEFEVEDDDTE